MIKKKRALILSMVIPSMLILVALTVFPLIYNFRNSFTDYYLLKRIAPDFIGIKNYTKILSDSYFMQAVKNTVLFTVLSVALETGLGVLMAVFLNSFTRGKKILRILIMLPMLVPPVTVALIWQTMFSNNYGIFNQLLGYIGIAPINWLMDTHTAFFLILLIDVWQYTPLAFLLIYAALQTVPQGQYEAAAIDGANGWAKFKNITLPNIIPGLLMTILLRTIDSFRLFDKVNILTKGGPANSTATITQYIYQYGTKSFEIGYASAASIIMTVIILVLASVYLYKMLKKTVN